MSLKVDRVQLDIIINNDPTRKQMQSLDNELRTLQKDIKKLAEGTEEWTAKSNRIKEIKSQMDGLKKSIGITGMTMKELISHQKELNMTLQHMRPGTKEFGLLQQELKETSSRINELRGKSSATGLSIGKMADGFNKYFGVAAAFAASFTGVILGVRKAIDAFNEFEDKVANLSALTGLAGSDLQWLSDKAKELSTSTTESGVRITSGADVIVDAFTKMGSAKPELLKDKEALASVTEQALILAEASKMELDDAVQGLANTMNQFGASADEASKYVNVLAAGAQAGAQEVPYISDAIVKFGAAAADFNIPIEQSVAMIEALGEKGLQAEVAGTGIRRFLLKLATGADETNPKVVGLSTAMDNLAAQNMSAGEMMKMFGEEGYIAAQNLIANKDRVVELTAAVTDTNVATEQAITNTGTNSAKLEQAKNKAKLMAIELGEKLAPALTFSTNAMSYMMKALKVLIDFYLEHRKSVNALVAGIITYTVVTNAAALAQRALEAATKIAAMAQKAFNTAIKSSPWGLILTAIASVVMYLITYEKKLSSIEKAQKSLNDAQAESAKIYNEEKYNVEMLVKIAKDETQSKENRKKAIQELNRISPEYLGNLSLETINTNEAKKALDDYLGSLEKKIKAEVLYEKLKENIKKQSDIENSNLKNFGSSWDNIWNGIKNRFTNAGETSANMASASDEAYLAWADRLKQLNDLKIEQMTLEKEYNDILKAGATIPTSSGDTDIDSGGATGSSVLDSKKKDIETKLEELRNKARDINRQMMLDAMAANNRELSIIRDKYQKELEIAGISAEKVKELKAKNFLDMTAEEQSQWNVYLAINDAQAAELAAKKAEQHKKEMQRLKEEKEAKEAFMSEVYNISLSDMDAEIMASQDKYAKLIDQAQKFGLDYKGLLEMASAENELIRQKYRDIELKKEREKQDKINAAQLGTLSSTSRIIGSIMDAMGKKSEKNARYQQALGLAQIGIDTGVAVASGVRSAMQDWGTSSVWEKIGAVVAVVAEIVSSTASAINLVQDANVPQYAEGLWPVIGQQTGRRYMSSISANSGTRVIKKPTMLVAEEKPEMIIDGNTYSRMEMNAPELIRAIYAFRSPQFAGGYYPAQYSNSTGGVSASDGMMITMMDKLMQRLDQPIQANVEYRRITEMSAKEQQISNDFNG